MKNLFWEAFCKTGDVDAYLLYNEAVKTEKRKENLWGTVKQEGLSQGEPTMESQML